MIAMSLDHKDLEHDELVFVRPTMVYVYHSSKMFPIL